MASDLTITVNGQAWLVQSSADTPLLYVLTNELHLHGPRFGCGLAQCGSCSVLADDKEIRSCVTPVATVKNRAITTLEGERKASPKDQHCIHCSRPSSMSKRSIAATATTA
jgi:aerobic-type carbon monoxide dehydrogenase small subunit (CoxS/CutS family)